MSKFNVLKNIGYLSSVKGLELFLPLFLVPYLIRTVGMERYGEIVFAGAVTFFFRTLIQYGFQITAVRDIARNREDSQATSAIVTNTFYCNLLLSVMAGGGFIVLTEIVLSNFASRVVMYPAFFVAILHGVMPYYYFQGVDRMRLIAYFSFLSNFLFIILVFSFIRNDGDYSKYYFINAIALAVSLVVALVYMFRVERIALGKYSFNSIWLTLTNGFNAFIAQLMPNLYNNLMPVLLGLFGGVSVAGVFRASSLAVDLAISAYRVVVAAVLPNLSRNLSRHTMFAKYLLLSSIFITIVLIVSSGYIAEWISPSSNIQHYLVILAISIPGAVGFLVFNTGYLFLVNRGRTARNIVVVTSLVFSLFGLLATYIFSVVGACVVIAAARLSLFLWSLLESQKGRLE